LAGAIVSRRIPSSDRAIRCVGINHANPVSRKILIRHLPGVVQSGNIERMGGITLRRVRGMAPQMISDAALAAIDAELAKLARPE
jgi:hypothetical protein